MDDGKRWEGMAKERKEEKGRERKGRERKAREIDQSYCYNSWTQYLYAISILTFLILCLFI